MSPRITCRICILLLAFCLFCVSCSGKRPPRKIKAEDPGVISENEQMPMPRADPGFLQHLERYSMLAQSSEMAKVVSGSELAWRGSAGSPGGMLGFADTWVQVNPTTLLTSSRSGAFEQLGHSGVWPVLREAGAKGLYVAPLQGSGSLWAKNRKGPDHGDDVVQYDFSRPAGDEAGYKRLMRGVIDNSGLLGSDLVPAATGLGPDFFLAARNVREFPGIYCMVEIPEKLWKHLPDTPSEWEGAILSQAQVNALNGEGLLPKSMRDGQRAGSGGWAATGAVRGVDGNSYRWAYRYYGSPEYAVLNWEDPSQAAHRILSGSAVRQVGLQGQALIGLKFAAFQGLDPAPDRGDSGDFSIEPARTAAQSMSREIRRYGGWTWLKDDNLSLSHLQSFLSSGADFVFDSVFSPASEHALLTGDAELVRLMADNALKMNIDATRLVHAMPAQEGLNYSLSDAGALRGSALAAMRSAASRISPSPAGGRRLYSTAPGLAALALNAVTAADAQAKAKDIAAGHSLLIFFKAMQPGVVMLAGQDLVGVLPLQWGGIGTPSGPSGSARGAYGLTASALARTVSGMGTPKAPNIYAPADSQVHDKNSFLSTIGAFLRQRAAHGIAKGKLIARPETKGKGSIALLTRLPDGKHLLSVCNFSREAVAESITLPGISGLGNNTAIRTGGKYTATDGGINVSLGPWQGLAVVIGRGGGSASAAQKQDGKATEVQTGNDDAAKAGE